jgi:hypothetical protein
MARAARSKPRVVAGDSGPLVLSETETAESDSATTSNEGFLLKPRPYTLTMPPPDDYYFVREDQLDGLTERTKSHSMEIALAAGFGSLGFFQNAAAVVAAIYKGEIALIGTGDLLASFLCLGLIVLSITKFAQFRGAKSSADELKTKIKSGQKATVTND